MGRPSGISPEVGSPWPVSALPELACPFPSPLTGHYYQGLPLPSQAGGSRNMARFLWTIRAVPAEADIGQC